MGLVGIGVFNWGNGDYWKAASGVGPPEHTRIAFGTGIVSTLRLVRGDDWLGIGSDRLASRGAIAIF